MPRQNFVARESFVDAAEQQVKDSLLSIPAFAANIRLLAENKLNESFRFSYELPVKKTAYHIDACVLPLNKDYTRISLHGRFASGQAFVHDADMAIALHDFESALHAAIRGEASAYQPYEPKTTQKARIIQMATGFVAAAGMFFLRRKLS